MGEEQRPGQMVLATKGSTPLEENMVSAPINGMMGANTRVSGRKIGFLELESISGSTEGSLRESGKTTTWRD